MHPIAPHWLNFIDGQWTDSEQHLSIHNPGTTDLVATIAQASVPTPNAPCRRLGAVLTATL